MFGHLDPNESLTVSQVLEVLKISRSTFYNLYRTDPAFITYRVGRARRMRGQALIDWVSAREQASW